MTRLPALLFVAILCLAQTGTKSGYDRSMLDTSCKPCDDFWRYATGGWTDANPIPADKARWGTFDQLRDANLERLKTILDATAASPSVTGDAKRMGDYYAACMNTAAIETVGVKPLQPLLDRIAAMRTRDDLRTLLTRLEMGMNLVTSVMDPDNTAQTIATIGAGGLSLPDRDYYFREDTQSKKIREEFLSHVQLQLESLGDPAETAAARARLVLEFETALANATLTNVALRDPYQLVHKMEFAKLIELAPAYDWETAFKVLNAPTTGFINVSLTDFVREMDRQMREAPIETWKGWLRWRLVNDRAPYLSKKFFDEDFRFNRTVLSGVTEQPPRWQTCAQSVDSNFGDVLGKLYVDKYFPSEAQRQMRDLVENLRASLGEQLQSADWLEEETRKNALRKLEAFDPQIGFPTKWRTYERVEVARDGYLDSNLSANRERRIFDAAKIGKETDREEWGTTAPTVNAYYSALLNAITFPAGILQPPFFDMNADSALNYGAIGAVIGHEMGHGWLKVRCGRKLEGLVDKRGSGRV
jgi:predicted metalloendopeptidase